MPKTKHRKGHAQKAAAYKRSLKDGERLHIKFLKDLQQKYINQLNLINPEQEIVAVDEQEYLKSQQEGESAAEVVA
jgi:hypothetical protein